MKLTFKKSNIQAALKLLQKIIPHKPQLPALAGMKLEAADTTIKLSGTDLFTGVQTTLSATVSKPGTVLLPAKESIDLLLSLDEGTVQLESSDDVVHISQGSVSATLPVIADEQFPDFPEVVGKEVVLSEEVLEIVARYVALSASTDQARPVLTGVYFSPTAEGVELVATDGFRLSVSRDTLLKSPTLPELLVPATILKDAVRSLSEFGEGAVSMYVAPEERSVLFEVGTVRLYTQLIEGSFPPYQKIVPTQFSTTIRCDVGELLSHCKRAQIFGRSQSDVVQFVIDAKQFKILGGASAAGQYEAVIDTAEITGESVEVAFNVRYLLDILQSVKTGEVHIQIQESLKPTRWELSDVPEVYFVVMPFRLNE